VGPVAGPVAGTVTALMAVLVTVLLAAAPAAAAAVNIVDDSHVLDVTRVQNEAATLPDPVAVYTTTKFADDKAAFDRETQSKASAPTIVVIAINTQSRHLAIRTGTRSRVTQSAARAATDAFTSTFRSNSDYTAATIAALDSMRGSIARGGGTNARTAHRSGASTYLSGCVCLLLVGVVIALIVFLVRRGRGRRAGRPGGPAGYGPAGYGQPGYGQPGYGQPGYGQPGYGGGQGVNPWLAGGAGAVAGGVLGYELGRMEGEHGDHDSRGYDDGGYGGGGADGDFGGGGGGDFGGGGDSGGGGGDF
jgi:hypothetical protein